MAQCQLYQLHYEAAIASGLPEGSEGFIAAGKKAEVAVYKGYQAACKRFVQVALRGLKVRELNALNQVVWVQDYQMWYVLPHLKQASPDLVLGYFHHIPFPAPEVLVQFPAAREFLQALLHADFIDFHSQSYADHFIACVCKLFPGFLESLDANQLTLVAGSLGVATSRTITIGVKPIGVDKQKCQQRIADPVLSAELRERKSLCLVADLEQQRNLASEMGCDVPEQGPCFGLEEQQAKLFVWVGRLDHTKGLPSTFNVFHRYVIERESLLRKLAEAVATGEATAKKTESLRAKLNTMPPAFLQVVAPPARTSVLPYSALVNLVKQKVAKLFSAYQAYFNLRLSSVPAEGMKALFNEGDVTFVPVYPSDGYNLVVAEAVCSCQPGQGATVIVSDGAGVASQVSPEVEGGPGAIIVATRDEFGEPLPLEVVEVNMLGAMKRAVQKTAFEQKLDAQYMAVRVGDVHGWGEACLAPIMEAGMRGERFVYKTPSPSLAPGQSVGSWTPSFGRTGGETPGPASGIHSVASSGDLLAVETLAELVASSRDRGPGRR